MTPTDFAKRYGPWAVVSGASAGIGRSFALQLAARGVGVALIARDDARLRDIADQIVAMGGRARSVRADLGTDAGRRDALAAVDDLDVGLLIASAGQRTIQEFAHNPLEDEMRMIDVNCRALAEMAHHFSGRFLGRNRGGLVLLSSILAFQGVPNSANYAATKAYVQSLAEGLGHEMASTGVDVLSVAPGPVSTGTGARAGMRLGATVSSDEVAAAALNALGRQRIVRPGAATKLRGALLAPLPRAARVAMMGRVMRKMTARMDARRRAEKT